MWFVPSTGRREPRCWQWRKELFCIFSTNEKHRATFYRCYAQVKKRSWIVLVLILTVGSNRIVGTATGCGLGGPGIKSWWKRDFTHPSWHTMDSTQPPVRWVMRPGRDVDQSLHLFPWLKKEYSYTSSVPLGLYSTLIGRTSTYLRFSWLLQRVISQHVTNICQRNTLPQITLLCSFRVFWNVICLVVTKNSATKLNNKSLKYQTAITWISPKRFRSCFMRNRHGGATIDEFLGYFV